MMRQKKLMLREAAARAAMRECRASGNRSCKVAVWFEVCGAYAGDPRYYGIGWGTPKRKLAAWPSMNAAAQAAEWLSPVANDL